MAYKATYKNVCSWDEMPVLMTSKDVAMLLKIPEDTVRHYCETKQLPAVKIGRLWRIDKQLLMKQFGYRT